MPGQEETGRFMALPASVLWNMADVLADRGVGERAVLYDAGYRTGLGVGQSSSGHLEAKDFPAFLSDHWLENGLGRPSIKAEGSAFDVAIDDAAEPRPPPRSGRLCSFSAGYLAGIATALLGRKYVCEEYECKGQEAARCRMTLRPADEE